MSPEAFRLLAAFIGIILLVLLVARLKWHPFLALMFISWGLAVTCGIDPGQAIVAFSKGFGDILSFVGIVIGLGTMIGGLLVSSGGADAFANAMIAAGGRKYVPWTIFFRGISNRLTAVFRGRVCPSRTIGVRYCHAQGPMKAAFDLIGNPIVALFVTVVVAVFVLGVRLGENLDEIQRTLNKSLEPIAAVILIVGAGGGFKEVLLET